MNPKKQTVVAMRPRFQDAIESPPEAVYKPDPAPKPVIIHRPHWGREVWAILIFVAGMATCEVINLVSTAGQFEQISKAVFQADVAHRILEKTEGQ